MYVFVFVKDLICIMLYYHTTEIMHNSGGPLAARLIDNVWETRSHTSRPNCVTFYTLGNRFKGRVAVDLIIAKRLARGCKFVRITKIQLCLGGKTFMLYSVGIAGQSRSFTHVQFTSFANSYLRIGNGH